MKEDKKTKAKPTTRTTSAGTSKPKGDKKGSDGNKDKDRFKFTPLPGTGTNGPI